MSGEHFTLTISQSTSDSGDFAIHMKEQDQPEQLLVHLRFSNLPLFDDVYLDDLTGVLARNLAKRVIEWRIAPDDPETMASYQDKTNAIVQDMIARMKSDTP